MTKRLIRYSNIQKAMEQENIVKQASNSSIVLKDGKLYTGKILEMTTEQVVFENMRLKKCVVSTKELSELIIDVRSE